jgi:hypothetical protein
MILIACISLLTHPKLPWPNLIYPLGNAIGNRMVEQNRWPHSYNCFLSDDGTAVFFRDGGFQIGNLTKGVWKTLEAGGERILYSKDLSIWTTSQAAHLMAGVGSVDHYVLASPSKNQILVIAEPGDRRVLALVNFDKRGKDSNDLRVLKVDSSLAWACLSKLPGQYELYFRNTRISVRVSKDKLTNFRRTRLKLSPSIWISRSPHDREDIARGRPDALDPMGLRAVFYGADEQGKYRLFEWSPKGSAVGRFSVPPPTQRESRPSLFYWRDRLLSSGTVDLKASSSSLYEAKADRSGWTKRADVALVAMSANGRYWLIYRGSDHSFWLAKMK